ncbi:hypothetical protein [Nocardioides baculatus]|jgi:hypothetical protein|uniref:Uncharacterized protein n=1 Tax=Nocardioides baculatus TaxID=2801337 RepID=A0ABS1LCD0_9ACTN|nr:hypothetical protein [Nocardioides baculatus]MBL0749339.1 hypothetical protein [Nocardioides baculatus]
MPRDSVDHYQPSPYDPSDRRDVGTGKDFAADLWALYEAGRLHFPELAAFYSEVTSATHDAAQRISHLQDSTGGEYALTLVGKLRELLQVELRSTSLAMSETGEALVEIADDYATTDQTANDRFRVLAGRSDIVVPYVPSPPGLDAPYETPYDAPDRPDDAPLPILPDGPPWLGTGDGPELDDVVPEEPLQEHRPTPEQQFPFLHPDLLEQLPDPQPEPEPEPVFPSGPFAPEPGSELDDGENELHLDDLIETPEERRERFERDGWNGGR